MSMRSRNPSMLRPYAITSWVDISFLFLDFVKITYFDFKKIIYKQKYVTYYFQEKKVRLNIL